MNTIRIPIQFLAQVMNDIAARQFSFKDDRPDVWAFTTTGGNTLHVRRVSGSDPKTGPYDSLDFSYNDED